jgi:hypothetical protein
LERGLKSPTLNKIDELAEVMEVHPITLLVLAYADPNQQSTMAAILKTVTSELASFGQPAN